MKHMMGNEAENIEKADEEGGVETLKVIWWANFNSETAKYELPTLKLVKATCALSDPRLDNGNVVLNLNAVQVLGGNALHWVVPNPALRFELGAVYNLSGTIGPGSPYVSFQHEEETRTSRRILVSSGTVPFNGMHLQKIAHELHCVPTGLLGQRERLGLIGQDEKTVFTGRDASHDRA